MPDRFEIRGSGGERLASVDLPGEDMFLAVHRADLHSALRGAVPGEWVRMGTTPAAIEDTGDAVAVTFDDGTTARYDVVVGADGVHSAVREMQFTDWTVADRDTVVWSFWTPP
ncbi:MAG: 2-polyprenyl-6-methoxyphenol hydroxylase, partial [Candidatus Nanohaloarchaea archaeon]